MTGEQWANRQRQIDWLQVNIARDTVNAQMAQAHADIAVAAARRCWRDVGHLQRELDALKVETVEIPGQRQPEQQAAAVVGSDG